MWQNFPHLPKFVVFSDSSSSESFVFFFPCFSFSAFCLKYLTRKGKVIYSFSKISQLSLTSIETVRIIRTKPTTSTIHKGTPIVVISFYLTFSGKIPIFLCVNAKKINDIWQIGEMQPRSQGSLLPVPDWENCYWRRFYLTTCRIQIFKWGPRVFKGKEKRGGGGGLGFQFGLKIRWGQGIPPFLTPWSANDITDPWTKKYELAACLSKRLYCIKFETDWF